MVATIAAAVPVIICTPGCYRLQVTCPMDHLSEGSFVRNGVAQIPKFNAKPNPNPNLNPDRSPNPMPIHFGQITLWTSELSPLNLYYHPSQKFGWRLQIVTGAAGAATVSANEQPMQCSL